MGLSTPVPAEIGGYVLAGGRSSRMGREKALIPLAGKPLVEHAVTKLRRICAEVSILSANPALAAYAPLVPDLHPGCGPIGGIEAALAHTVYEWNLFLAVDMPLLPTAFIERWAGAVLRRSKHVRVALFAIDRMPEPALVLLHRDVAPVISELISQGRYGLFAALDEAASRLAPPGACALDTTPFEPAAPIRHDLNSGYDWVPPAHPAPWQTLTDAQYAAEPSWFSNINTLEALALAEANAAALDT